MRTLIRRALGAVLWLALAGWAGSLLTERRDADAGTLASIGRHWLDRDLVYHVELPVVVALRVGDVVEIAGNPAGEIDALLDDAGRVIPDIIGFTRRVRVKLQASRTPPLRADAAICLLEVPQAAAWVVKTLFTPDSIPRIAAEWNDTMLRHRDEIFALLTPVVRDLIIDVERHVEAELPAFVARHRAELQELGEAVKRDLGGARLTALFEEQIWPIARPKLMPIVQAISDEVWQKLPLWTLTWRLAYQTLPLTDNNHLQRALAGFLDAEALPILRAHLDEMLAATRAVAKEALAREEVHTALREGFGAIVAHPRFHAIAQAFLRELMLDNPRFHELLMDRARSSEAQRALAAAGVHIEPMVRRMGDIVLGTRDAGITREFAKVLRSQILLKDQHRLVLEPGSAGAAPLAEGSTLKATVAVEHGR